MLAIFSLLVILFLSSFSLVASQVEDSFSLQTFGNVPGPYATLSVGTGGATCTVPYTTTPSCPIATTYTQFDLIGENGNVLHVTGSGTNCVFNVVRYGSEIAFASAAASPTANGGNCTSPTLQMSTLGDPNNVAFTSVTVTGQNPGGLPLTIASTDAPAVTCYTFAGASPCTTVGNIDGSFTLILGNPNIGGPSFKTFTLTEIGNMTLFFYVAFEEGNIVGDPQFVGFRGQSFQVHGIDGAAYNLISDETMQFNARFTFLSSGKCPSFEQSKALSTLENCYSHPGSYIGEMAIQQLFADGSIVQLIVVSGSAATGFKSISLGGEKLKVGATVAIQGFALNYTGSHTVAVETPFFHFEFDNSDKFINQRVRVKVPLSTLSTHGLLGQTSKRNNFPGSIKYIEGEVDDYSIANNDILGNDFIFNKFMTQ